MKNACIVFIHPEYSDSPSTKKKKKKYIDLYGDIYKCDFTFENQ